MVEPGQVLDGKYRIVRLIGEGGMGAVFEGENIRINRRVAIKVLHGAALSNAETVQRFEREAQAAGRIGSDHILEILDLGVLADGERYMVMEFLAGMTLTARIRQHGRLTPPQIMPLMRQALVGLGAAHAAGIIHRDLKPDNLFILNERSGLRDYVKIIDFGISKFNALGGDMSMTRTGAVMGTPYYMSPEQAKGSGNVDARSDLYAIGVILYEAVSGEVPFLADTFNELMFKIVLSDPKPLLEVVPDLDPRFAAIVAKAMAKDVAQRYGSAAEMIQAFDALTPALAGTGAGAWAPVPAGSQVELSPAQAVTSPGQATQGSFATSQQDVSAATVPGKRSGAGLAAGIAVLVVVGGAFGAYKAFGGKPPVEAREEHAPSATAVSAPPPVEAVQPAPKVPPTVAAVVGDAPSAVPSAAVAPSAAVTPSEAAAPSAEASATPAAIAGRPRVVAAPRPGPAKPAAPASTKPATPGKSSRDFGY